MPRCSDSVLAKSRYSSALGPSVPFMFLGKPMTISPTSFSRTSRSSSSRSRSSFRVWITVVEPTMEPVRSERATPVRASP